MKKKTLTRIDNVASIVLFIYIIITPIFIDHNRAVFMAVTSIVAVEKLIYINIIRDDISKRKYWLNVGFEILILILLVLSLMNILPIKF
ncbi:hypothetical protein [Breznakia pachnodae]|uniref:Uncharacterized protein n=1 Tax=Breznakia pachnodae TaxID=265178 RepID=A0ABU0E2Q2_9FIRM|nr:hypothetical protein [Breznakia pachnodae]MDQ0361106.1 hypothetical protein [Breznakia pachnodae]